MVFKADILSQSSFELTGNRGFINENLSLSNSFEVNPSNYFLLKDWGLSFSYGGEFSDHVNSNIYLLSLSKRFSEHFISLRYTPGYQKDFILSTGESIFFEDSTTQTLNSKFSYKELFGLAYSYRVSGKINAGLSLRYFMQEFETEFILPVFGDTNYIMTDGKVETDNFWKGDIGISYSPIKELLLSVGSINLFSFGETNLSDESKSYSLKKDKAAQFGISYNPINELELNFIYETNKSLQAGLNTYFKFSNNNFGFGLTAFRDKLQTPFFAGIIPAVSYSNNLFGITISGVKYFSDRSATQSFSEFNKEGLANIINNKYSFDKAILTVTFALNTIQVQSVELLDVEVVSDIYPTLGEFYLDFPFAIGKVVNLTKEPVSVKPYSRVEGMNNDNIQSPEIIISGNDTVEVEFFTLVPDEFIKTRPEISYADFYVSVSNDEPDDQFQKAVLVNGNNSWDGKVRNLKYFIKKDLDFSLKYAKEILGKHKREFDELQSSLYNFHKTEIIFNEVVKNLSYTSDPRASSEYVQFPGETIKLKGGDCDDFSVLFSSLLESIGVETALVDYKTSTGVRHVNILVNTGLKPGEATLITGNDTKYFLRKNEDGDDEIWIPVETTSLSDFNTAWSAGIEKFNKEAIRELGIAKGTVEIIDIY